MIKSILVIVPHQDDEVNLIGSIMDQCSANAILVNVVFMTNGDYHAELVKQRFKETKKVLKVLGFNKAFFLGYGDKVKYQTSDRVSVSEAGHSETYGVGEIQDYRYEKSGYHSVYTIENIKKDLKECILNNYADMIIVVDNDNHPDHRLLSRIFDECMKDLICQTSYRPIVLKKFAYQGVWLGASDYFDVPVQCTLPVFGEKDYSNVFFPYVKNQEVRIKVTPMNTNQYFWKTPVFRALVIYRSQYAISQFLGVVNADALYFFRSTYNIALNAKISVSSGKKDLLNDFKLVNIVNCYTNRVEYKELIKNSTWMYDKDDREKRVMFTFDEEQKVHYIVFYQFQYDNSAIKKVAIQVNNQKKEIYNIYGKYEVVKIDKKNVKNITISVIESVGKYCGFQEIEIYDKMVEFDWSQVPFEKYVVRDREQGVKKEKVVMRKLLKLLFLCTQKISNYNQKVYRKILKIKI